MAANPENLNATVTFTLDGKSIAADAHETILNAAKRNGIEIPRLCYKEGLRADGNCRACMVEIDGERVLAPSCCRNVSEGMVVQSGSERARASQKMVLELLQSRSSERQGRVIDKDANASMEKKKQEGYF